MSEVNIAGLQNESQTFRVYASALPVQVLLGSLVKPGLQEQVKEPGRSVQMPLTGSQSCMHGLAHSL